MDAHRLVAVTGTSGRVGSALLAALREDGQKVVAWQRPELDLDDVRSLDRLVARDRPALIFHAAAWTDVDGCARDPDLCRRRNGEATAALAKAAAASGADLVYVSTNEVFDGRRNDGRGYREDDPASPINPYGQSKMYGEEAIRDAYASAAAKAWIVRTSWVFGPPGTDFPARIVAAYDRSAGSPLRVVEDETGRPTFAPDLARGLIRLCADAPPGTYHLAGAGACSRRDWAQEVLDTCRPGAMLEGMLLADYRRDSTPPRWGVLDTGRAEEFGISLRSWREPLAAYVREICPEA